MQNYIYVRSASGKPLMPTTRSSETGALSGSKRKRKPCKAWQRTVVWRLYPRTTRKRKFSTASNAMSSWGFTRICITSDVFEGIVSEMNEDRALIIVQDKMIHMRLWCDDNTVDDFEKTQH